MQKTSSCQALTQDPSNLFCQVPAASAMPIKQKFHPQNSTLSQDYIHTYIFSNEVTEVSMNSFCAILVSVIFHSGAPAEFAHLSTKLPFLFSALSDFSSFFVRLAPLTSCFRSFFSESVTSFSATAKLGPYENATASFSSKLEEIR